MNEKKWMGVQHDQSTFPNAQLCFPSVWSDWLIVKTQCVLANPWGTDGGHITDTICIFCPSTWPGLTPASNWKLPSALKVCMKLIQWHCSPPGESPNILHHKSRSKQVHHSLCYVSTGPASFLSLKFLFWCNRHRDVERLVCEWRRNEWMEEWARLSEHVAAGRALTGG